MRQAPLTGTALWTSGGCLCAKVLYWAQHGGEHARCPCGFWRGLAAQPLGAIAFRPMADRLSREPMMLVSVAALSVFSLAIGSLPTADSVCWLAEFLLVVVRLLQGLSIGVERPLLSSYVVELAPKGRVGWCAGMMQAATSAGIMLASTVTFCVALALDDERMAHGWNSGQPSTAKATFGHSAVVIFGMTTCYRPWFWC